MISGFHCGVNEVCALLGLCWHFRATYRSHLEGSGSPSLLDAWRWDH